MGLALLLIAQTEQGVSWPVLESSLTLVWGNEKKQKHIRQAVTAHLKKCRKGKDSL